MKDIPIIFSGPMVRALLDGRKTMTRRLAWRPWHQGGLDYASEQLEHFDAQGWNVEKRGELFYVHRPSPWQRAQPGDRLWVREAFMPRPMLEEIAKPHYRADPGSDRPEWRGLYKPSIHMPRRFSRITLTVTATKIERLQDISYDDVLREGVSGDSGPGQMGAFMTLWEKLHGSDAWATNPEVVALSFIVNKQNIDALPKSEAA